MADQI